MKAFIIIAAALISGCSMSPTQKRWTAIGVSVVATGLILAHESDNGRGPLSPTATASGGKKGPFNPCPSGNSQGCK